MSGSCILADGLVFQQQPQARMRKVRTASLQGTNCIPPGKRTDLGWMSGRHVSRECCNDISTVIFQIITILDI